MPIRRKYRVQTIQKSRKKAGILSKLVFSLPKIREKKKLITKRIKPGLLRGAMKYRKVKTRGLKKIFYVFLKLGVLFLILGAIATAGAFIYFSKDIPSPDKIVKRSVWESTKIYDRTGQHLLYEIHGEEKRTIVNLDQISKNLINSTIATEDKNFYKHHGIDFVGIIRAIYTDVRNMRTEQGGSTITQQLIKNSLLTSERTVTRKIKEIILAIETEQKFSKDQILEMYMNQIPYGSNAYGAEAAAQTFFGKSAKDLDIPESALLAALPKATTYYSPYGTHQDQLIAKYKFIIDQMKEQGYITEEEAKNAKDVEIIKRVRAFVEKIEAPHFVMYVKQQLVDEFGEEKVEKGGLKVYTTLNYDMQMIAEDAIKKMTEENLAKYNARDAALIAMDPKDGEILSMVGSKDYFNIKEDGNVNAAIAPLQPGSSFKPFVYATAFKKGYTPNTILFDVETNFGKDGSGKEYIPNNYNMKYSGPVTMRQALARSLNIPAVKALYLSGIKESIDTAHDLGITTLNNPGRYGLSLVLGTGEVKLIDMVSAYGVFANDGVRSLPISVLKIEDADGKILKEASQSETRVLDEEIARNINSILSDNNARAETFGPASKLYIKDRPVAAKSGTTSSFKDAWTVGYTPSLVSGVWTGNSNGDEMKRGADGSKIAAPIWNDFMTRVLALDPVEKFPVPQEIEAGKPILDGKAENEVIVKTDKACTDRLASELTPESQIEEKTFIEIHDILYYVKKDDPRGDPPESPEDDPQFRAWEDAVQTWAKENMADKIANIAPTEVCNARSKDDLPSVKILNPQNDAIINQNNIKIEAEGFANLGIEQIEFYFDNELVGIDKFPPFEAFYNISQETKKDIHAITARIYDKIFNSSEDRISVVTGNDISIYFMPVTNDSFPYVMSVVTAGEKFTNISFYSQLESIYDTNGELIEKPGSRRLIQKATSPVPGENNLYQALWDEDREYVIPGKYKLFVTAEDQDGNLYESNSREMEISPVQPQ
ncbi:MAG: PBP1A family penicillin-binding protein [Candidatus Paceibacterota bacterium]